VTEFGDWRAGLEHYEFPTQFDRDFYTRVYQTDPAIYRRRLQAVGFEGLGRVADLGCGYGQWSLMLAALNDEVVAVDVSAHRAAVVTDRARDAGRTSLVAMAGSLDDLPLASESVDGLFCYGAVFFVDWRKAFAEFQRVLRPGGRLYVCANGLGWFLWYLVTNHNAGPRFRPRRIALAAIANTIRFRVFGRAPERGQQLAMSVRAVRSELGRLGFRSVQVDGEGRLGQAPPYQDSFFLPRWAGLPAVYELVGERE